MPVRQPKLPVGGGITTGAGDDEEQAIKALFASSKCFSLIASCLVRFLAKQTGYRRRFQTFRMWSRKFSEALLTAKFQDQRQTFLKLAQCTKRRSKAVLLFLYLFAQQTKTEQYSDAHFREEESAAMRLNALIGAFNRDTKPHLDVLEKALGMWPHSARQIRSLIQEITMRVRKPGTKRNRNAIHRSVSQTLLGLSVKMCGHRAPEQENWSLRGKLFWWTIWSALGSRPEINQEQGRGLAQVAAFSAGKWMSLEALKKLYYEELDPASEALAKHFYDHR